MTGLGVTFLVPGSTDPGSERINRKRPALRQGLEGAAVRRRSGFGPRGGPDAPLSFRFPVAAAEGGAGDHSPRAAASPAPRPSPAPNTSMAHAAGP